MTSRLKEDERNERTIRNLLKFPENRRCINCNSLGPQYVCTNFSTFVCTICSGIHREFTHRVKSVSMAKFTSQEVTALQGGGNAKAKEIYFKEWDPQRQSLPDSSNIERLRDFIRHVYVDRRYTGEKWVEKSPIKRPISNGGSDDRSPKNSNEERRYEDVSSPPIIRPVRDILGEKVSPLKIIEPPKTNGLLRTQKSVSSNINPVAEVKTESSLIDFDAVPEPPPPSTTQPPQMQQPSTSPNTNWASFDSVQEVKTSHTPSNTNLLDALSELSVSTPPQSSLFRTTAPVLAPITNQAPIQSFSQADVTSTAKKELPVDLFTSNYSAYGGPGPGWFPTPQYGMGFNMQYNVSAHMPPAYLQPSRPLYPFNVDESSSVQFPSMVPLQGALPNMAFPSGLHRTSSLGTFSQTWMPTQSSTIHRTSSLGTPSPAWMPTQPQLPPHGQFMGQPLPNMPPPPRQQVGGFGSDNTSFKSYNYNQQQSGPSFSSSRGNPFG